MQVTAALARSPRWRSRPAEQAGDAVACAPHRSRLKPGHALVEDCTTSDCWASSAARWRAIASRCAAICSRCTTRQFENSSAGAVGKQRAPRAQRWSQPLAPTAVWERRGEQPLRARAWRVISSSILATRSRSSLSAPFCERRRTTRRPAGRRAGFAAKAARDERPAEAPATAITGMRRDVAIAQTLLEGSASGEGRVPRRRTPSGEQSPTFTPHGSCNWARTDAGRTGAEWCAYKTQGRERCAARPSRRPGPAQTAARSRFSSSSCPQPPSALSTGTQLASARGSHAMQGAPHENVPGRRPAPR